MASEKPIVIARIDEDGVAWHSFSGAVDLYVIDERMPHDRIYKMSTETPREDLASMINGPVGSKDDARHEAVAGRINAAMNGARHLKLAK